MDLTHLFGQSLILHRGVTDRDLRRLDINCHGVTSKKNVKGDVGDGPQAEETKVTQCLTRLSDNLRRNFEFPVRGRYS